MAAHGTKTPEPAASASEGQQQEDDHAHQPEPGSTGGGTPATITGTNLGSTGEVAFDGIPAPFTVINATTVPAVTPPGAAGAVDVTVTNSRGHRHRRRRLHLPGRPRHLTGNRAVARSIGAPVSVSSPPSGVAGGTVILTGTGFTGVTSGTTTGLPRTRVPAPGI